MDVLVKNLTKYYGNVLAIDNISFQVKHGEILGFLGPNGAGKTTTMKIITSFLAPSKGQVFVGDIDVEKYPEQARRHIGYLAENNPLYHEMFVLDFLYYMAALADVSKDKIRNRIKDIVQVCGIDEVKHKRIGHLSKGYRQRVGLAQALIHDAQVLILDEPTAGLDPRQIIEIRELIKQIGKEKTVILSSHILAEVEATCDRVLIINKGKIIADGTAADLKNKLFRSQKYKVQITNTTLKEIETKLNDLSNLLNYSVLDTERLIFSLEGKYDSDFAKDIFNFAVSQGWVLTMLAPEQTNLEDIFIQLTNEN